jgi:hypothetical protein
MTDLCPICGDSLNSKYVHTLDCNGHKHAFHYECLMKSYEANGYKGNQCPYCRTKHGFLPIIPGLKKLIKGVHYSYYSDVPEYENNQKCKAILKKGKRIGEECGGSCAIGYTYCARHNKNAS